MAKPKVLVVEDEAIAAIDIKQSLKRLGYDVIGTAATGKAAIEAVKKKKPDMVLMDIVLPGTMNGIAAAGKIRSRFNIPVVYLTAYADNETLERARLTGPFGYITKPFDDRELKATIEMALYKAEMEKELREGEERYRDLFENAIDLIQCVNPDGSFFYVNPAWQKTFGYSGEEISRLSLFDIIHPESREHCQEMFKRVVSGEDVSGVEADFVTRDGKKITLEGNVSCKLVDGKPVHTRAIFRDITERKKAEAEREKALSEVKRLSGLLPICANCKKIRDDKGYWQVVEQYVSEHSEAEFTHGLCPDCLRKLYPEQAEDIIGKSGEEKE